MALRRLEGQLLFPHTVVFSADLQDKESEITIGKHHGLIALPRLPAKQYQDDPGPELLPPSAAPGEACAKADHVWGRVVTSRNHFGADSAYLELELPGDKADFEGVKETDIELRTWLTILIAWLRVLTGQNLRHDAPLFWERPDMTPGWFYVRQDGQVLGEYFSASGHQQPYPGSTATEAEDWRRSLELASQGRPPDEARTFLQDASGSLDRKQARRCVLDASTASELVVTKALRARILDRNEEATADILLDRASLGRKVELCKKFGVWCPRQFTDRVTSVRNDVVHRAITPTWEQARLTLVETSKLLDHHFPFEWEHPYDVEYDSEDD